MSVHEQEPEKQNDNGMHAPLATSHAATSHAANGHDTSSHPSAATSQTDGPARKIFVKDLDEGSGFYSFFLVRDKSILNGKNGKAYISLVLTDNSGTVDARIWDNVEHLQTAFQNGDVVKVKGSVQIFQNRKQVVVHRIEKAQPEQFHADDFISRASRQPEEMLQQLLQIVASMQNPHLKQLTTEVLADPEVRARILVAPAAKTIHHAYVGGLLEHVLSICGIMKFLGQHYQNMNVDLLLFGAIFHDIGKIWELQVDNGISYTDRGKLIGHMVLAVELVEKKASRIFGFPDELKDLCKHIILSHHGKLEYGSPKEPAFLEAFVVAAVDDLDSKINTIDMFLKGERTSSTDKWSRYNQLFERYFYLGVEGQPASKSSAQPHSGDE